MAFQFSRICMRTVAKTSNAMFYHEQSCQYSRWSHRRPANVLLPEINSNLKEEKIIDLTEFKSKQKFQKGPKANTFVDERSKTNIAELKNDDPELFNFIQPDPIMYSDVINSQEKKLDSRQKHIPEKQQGYKTKTRNVFDESGEFLYKKLEYKDTEISNEILNLKSRKQRGKCGKILIEGWRLIADGLQAGCTLEKLIFSRKGDLEKLKPFFPQQGPQLYKMPYSEIQMWSNLDTSPGIMGIFQTPNSSNIIKGKTFPIRIICDNIREPGNLGSILRAALGSGCDQILLTKGCVDVWNSKVLRSAAGAHFRLPVHAELSWEEISHMVKSNTSLYIADSNGNLDYMEKPKIIPKQMKNIGSFKFDERSRKKQIALEDSEDICEEPDKIISENDMTFPVLPYYGVDFTDTDSITLVVGGETEGISEDCYRFGLQRMAARLHIPLTDGVDSLNSGTALAIIVFEIKRQLVRNNFKPETSSKINEVSLTG